MNTAQTIQSQFTGLSGRINTNSTDISAIQGDVFSLQGTVGNHTTSIINDINTHISGIQADILDVETNKQTNKMK
jgi:hypothetical protein